MSTGGSSAQWTEEAREKDCIPHTAEQNSTSRQRQEAACGGTVEPATARAAGTAPLCRPPTEAATPLPATPATLRGLHQERLASPSLWETPLNSPPRRFPSISSPARQ